MAVQPGVKAVPSLPAMAWRVSFRLVGWLPAGISLLAVAVGLALTGPMGPGGGNPSFMVRVVESIVPLFMGLQAALALSPESEPPLELLLACPRPFAWVLLERLAIIMGFETGIALAGNLVGMGLAGGEALPRAILRWLAPCVFLIGVATFGTQMTRQGVYGTLLVTLMWGGMLLGGDALVSRWPFLWPIHLYLRPESVPTLTYALNRGTLILAGEILTGLAASLTHGEERMLGISTRR